MIPFFGTLHKKTMKNVYPVIIKQDDDCYLVYVPDIDRNTEGYSLYDAIVMARDLIGTYSLDYDLPEPSNEDTALRLTKEKMDDDEFTWSDGTMVLVDIDVDAYRKRFQNKAVKKNCSIPYWLNEKAEAAGINFSRVLQEALIEKLEE